jgi:intraflagellar transport protein 56
LLRHNKCVISDGESALKIFPPLMELYPEAKLNLIIFYLRENKLENAY